MSQLRLTASAIFQMRLCRGGCKVNVLERRKGEKKRLFSHYSYTPKSDGETLMTTVIETL